MLGRSDCLLRARKHAEHTECRGGNGSARGGRGGGITPHRQDSHIRKLNKAQHSSLFLSAVSPLDHAVNSPREFVYASHEKRGEIPSSRSVDRSCRHRRRRRSRSRLYRNACAEENLSAESW